MSKFRVAIKKGARGKQVEKIQEELVNIILDQDKLVKKVKDEMGSYGESTFKLVKHFQGKNSLIDDGIVGTFTHNVLFLEEWSFMLLKPKRVKQPSWTCWAASFESVFTSGSARQRMLVKDFVKKYDEYLKKPRNSISRNGLRVLMRDFKLHDLIPASDAMIHPASGMSMIKKSNIAKYVYGEYLVKLLRNRHPIVFAHHENKEIGHCQVLFGISTEKGFIFCHFMDPLSGTYKSEHLSNLRKLREIRVLGYSSIPKII